MWFQSKVVKQRGTGWILQNLISFKNFFEVYYFVSSFNSFIWFINSFAEIISFEYTWNNITDFQS